MKKLFCLVLMVLCVTGCNKYPVDPTYWVSEIPANIHLEGESQIEGESIAEGEIIIIIEGESPAEGELPTEGEISEGETQEGEGEGEDGIMPVTEAWIKFVESPLVGILNAGSLDLSLTSDIDANEMPEFQQFSLLQAVLDKPSAPNHDAVEAVFRLNYAAAQAIVSAMRDGASLKDFRADSMASALQILSGDGIIALAMFDWEAFSVVIAGVATIAEPENIKVIDLLLNGLYPSYYLESWVIDLADAYGITIDAFDTSLGELLGVKGDVDNDGISNLDEYRYAELVMWGNAGDFGDRASDPLANETYDPQMWAWPTIEYTHVPAFGSDDVWLEGRLTGLYPLAYGIITYVSGAPITNLGEGFNSRPVPDSGYNDIQNLFAVVTPLNEDGTFSIPAFADHPTDSWAVMVESIVVPLSTTEKIVKHLGLNPDVTDKVAWTSFIRDWRSVEIPEFYALDVNMLNYRLYNDEVQIDSWPNPWSWIDNPNIYGSNLYPAGSVAEFSVGSETYLPYFMYWQASDQPELIDYADKVHTPDFSLVMDQDQGVSVSFAVLSLLPIYDPIEGEGENEGEAIQEGEEGTQEGETAVEGETQEGEGENDPSDVVLTPTIVFGCPDANGRMSLHILLPEGMVLSDWFSGASISYVGMAGPNGNWSWTDQISDPDVAAYSGDVATMVWSTSFEPWAPDHFRGTPFIVTADGEMVWFNLPYWIARADFLTDRWRWETDMIIPDGYGDMIIDFTKTGDCF